MFTWFKSRRRKKMLKEPFPKAWQDIISQTVVHYSFLDQDEREHLEQLVRFFISEKQFEGCGGLELTEEIKVVIAAQACLLVLGLPPFQYHDLDSVLVYPSTVNLPAPKPSFFDATPAIIPNSQPILGLAAMNGPVILVWDAVLRGARHPEHGHNVVYHEFAHILDMRDGSADGTPELPNRALFKDWVEICSREFLGLRTKVERGERTILDPYGAVHEAEFFAVATELFFDKPLKMKKEVPDLYNVLSAYYRQDTAARERRYKTGKTD